MNARWKRIRLLLRGGLWSIFTLLVVWGFRSSEEKNADGLPVYFKAPLFSLTDQSGKSFGSKDLLNKIWVTDFIFTTCSGVCPRMSRSMKMIQDRFGAQANFRMVSFTVDPETDRPDVLKAYARKQGAKEKNWRFLTGERESLDVLFKGFKIGSAEDPLFHSNRFILMDHNSNVRGFYEGTDPASVNDLLEDIETLI